MLINTQCEIFKNPKFTTPPSINSITFNKIDTSTTRSHFGAFENGVNVKNCVHRRSPDFKLLYRKFTCDVRKSESASSDTSYLSNACGEIWLNWHSCEFSDIRGGSCRDLRSSRNIYCTVWPLKMVPSGCPETSVANYQHAPRINNITEVDENRTLLDYDATRSGNSLPKFRDRQIGAIFKG